MSIRLHATAGDGVLGRHGDLIVLCAAPPGAEDVVDGVVAALDQVAQAGGDGTVLAERVGAAAQGVAHVAFAPSPQGLAIAVVGHAWAVVATEYGEQRLALPAGHAGVRSVLPGAVRAIRAGLGDVDTDAPVVRWTDLRDGTIRAGSLLLAVAADVPVVTTPDAGVAAVPPAAPAPPAPPAPAGPPAPPPPPAGAPAFEVPAFEAPPFEAPAPVPPVEVSPFEPPAYDPPPAPDLPPPPPQALLPEPGEPVQATPPPPDLVADPPAFLPPPPPDAPPPVQVPLEAPAVSPAAESPSPANPFAAAPPGELAAAPPGELAAAPPGELAAPPPGPPVEDVPPPPTAGAHAAPDHTPDAGAPAGPPQMAAVPAPSVAVDRSQPFAAVSLLAPEALAPVEARAPLPVVTRPDTPPIPDAPMPANPVADDAVEVIGVYCKNGHFDDPSARYCAICGISMAQQTHIPRRGPRPPLGVLVLDDGSIFTLDADYVVGRDPSRDPDVVSGAARPLRIEDPEGLLSRVHARIHLEGWAVQVVDLGSANGTGIWGPRDTVWQRAPVNTPQTVKPGTQIGVGRRQMRFESHTNT